MVDLGGFVRDPGGMVWGHPRGADPGADAATGLEDGEVEPGTHVMFDCHGTLDLYCWDGGKTWVVEGEPEGGAKQFADATVAVAEALLEAMRPGARVSQLQARAREVYRKAGVPDPASAVIFFHGLGLSHMDIEQTHRRRDVRTPTGCSRTAWWRRCTSSTPAASTSALWLEEVVAITPDGGRPLFSWGFAPLDPRRCRDALTGKTG